MARLLLTDEDWALIADLFPKPAADWAFAAIQERTLWPWSTSRSLAGLHCEL